MLLRAVPVAVVYALTLLAFAWGVDVSGRPGVPAAGLLAQLYYATGLFLLGGMDLGVPEGGPTWARALLWVAYFGGPAITTTAVVEGAIRLVNPRWLQRMRDRDHVVIVGMGSLGSLYLDAVGAVEPHRRVVAVDVDPEAPGAVEIARHRGNGVRFVRGDIRRAAVRRRLSLERAHAVVLVTDSDLVNLGAAWEIVGEHPGLRVAVHVADIGLNHTASRLAAGSAVRVFNSHEIAATQLFEGHLAAHFHDTTARDVVAIAGFGRFGQTILRYLVTHAADELARVIVVDRDATARVRQFAELVGSGVDEVVPADVADPEAWHRIAASLASAPAEPVVVLATDDDAANLQAAIGLRTRLPGARLFVRCRSDSAFVRQLAGQHAFEPLAVDRMLEVALRDHYAACFRP